MKMPLLMAILLGICATFFHYNKMGKDVILSLDMAIKSDLKVADSQLFYNTGNGYNEKESFRQPILCDDEYHPLKYRAILKNGYNLRFDPLNGRGSIRIKNLEFSLFYGKATIHINENDITQGNQIASIVIEESGALSVQTTTNATDPYLFINGPNKNLFNNFSVTKYIFSFFLKFSITFYVFLLSILHITEK